MKKKQLMLAAIAAAALAVFALAGCGSQSDSSSDTDTSSGDTAISVYSREDGSGTRSAFVELTGVEEDDVDGTVDSAVITNSTSVMLTSVSDDANGIGYVSLGSLNDTVKAVAVDGVEASIDTVKDGSYPIQRPFNIATQDDLSDVAQDFVDYILSADGQALIEEEGYVAVDDDAEAFETSGAEGKIVVAGSSSVSPVMEKLAEAYQEVNTNATIEIQTSDSSTGISMATEGSCDIGMASRELEDSEVEGGLSATTIAQDGIAVIVSNDNEVGDLTLDQIKSIFTGETTDWADVA